MWTPEAEQEMISMLQDLIRIDTSNPPGGERPAAEYIAKRFRQEGVEARILEKKPGRSNVVAVIPGNPEELPVLLISHIDVVPVDAAEWDFPGFEAEIVDGVLQGRGTIDTKHLTAMEMEAIFLILREKKTLRRTVIFIASADEEDGSTYGMEYLVSEYPEYFPPASVLSEGGGFIVSQEGKNYRLMTCGEKGNLTVEIRIVNEDPDALFDALCEVLSVLSAYDSGEILNAVTKRFREVIPDELTDTTIKNVWEYSTRNGMHPVAFDYSRKQAEEDGCFVLKVDFKLLPGMSKEEACTLFDDLLRGLPVTYTFSDYDAGYLSDIEEPFPQELIRTAEKYDPGVQTLPMIALGSTDGRFIATSVFGFSPLLSDVPFKKVLQMIHSRNECVTIPSLVYGGRVVYEALRRVTIEDGGYEHEHN